MFRDRVVATAIYEVGNESICIDFSNQSSGLVVGSFVDGRGDAVNGFLDGLDLAVERARRFKHMAHRGYAIFCLSGIDSQLSINGNGLGLALGVGSRDRRQSKLS